MNPAVFLSVTNSLMYMYFSAGIKHIKLAYDLGINTFDTADTYSNGISEVILGKAIKQHNLPRDEIVVVTKIYQPLSPDPNGPVMVGLSNDDLDKKRLVNQYGLSRKVRPIQ